MPAPRYWCSRGLTERKGSLVSRIETCFTGLSTRVTAKVSKNLKVLFDFIFSLTVGVGVVPRAESDEIPDIMEIQRAELSDDQDCFYNDEGINQMRIQVLRLHVTDFLLSKYNYQVVDIAPYHGYEEKLVDDIDEVKIVTLKKIF